MMDHFAPLKPGKGRDCPICGHDHPCGISRDSRVVMCLRVHDGPTLIRLSKDKAWGIHRHPDHALAPVKPMPRVKRVREKPIDWPSLCASFVAELEPWHLASMADDLGVSMVSLRRLGVGWCQQRQALTFPMFDSAGRMVGVRTRLTSGEKRAVPGSHNGIFIPTGLGGSGPMLIVEGPTNTAAALDLRFDVIGRPSNGAGHDHLLGWCRAHAKGRDVVILHDRDQAGSDAQRQTLRAAMRLGLALRDTARVRLSPPSTHNDIRDWLRAGATRRDVDAYLAKRPYIPPDWETRPGRASVCPKPGAGGGRLRRATHRINAENAARNGLALCGRPSRDREEGGHMTTYLPAPGS